MTKTTHPLKAGILTTEFWLTTVLDIAAGVAAIPAIHAISPTAAGICASVTTSVYAAQRGLLKVKTVQALPAVANVLDSGNPLDALLKEVEAEEQGSTK